MTYFNLLGGPQIPHQPLRKCAKIYGFGRNSTNSARVFFSWYN